MQDELLEVVDEKGSVLRIARRSEMHGNPSLMHRVVHVLVLNSKGDLLLQKRSMKKDVAPGKWDTSVGGHISPEEDILDAAKRELREELGISSKLKYLYSYIHTNPYETELVYTFSCLYEGEFSFDKEEIDEIRFWSIKDIKDNIGKGILSDNFEYEISTQGS